MAGRSQQRRQRVGSSWNKCCNSWPWPTSASNGTDSKRQPHRLESAPPKQWHTCCGLDGAALIQCYRLDAVPTFVFAYQPAGTTNKVAWLSRRET